MTLAVLSDDLLKQELISKNIPGAVEVVWADSVRSLLIIDADVYIDLQFELNPERCDHLSRLLPKPVFVNSVTWSTKTIGHNFIRICGWPSLLQRNITEIALPQSYEEQIIKNIFGELNWNYQVAPDVPGMITPRIISMIINEAYHTLGDEVSTREEIDIAMKLGTNYPMGPFEWSERIGLERVYGLLKELSRTDSRYAVAKALEQEVSRNK